jgi:hypothetical protein
MFAVWSKCEICQYSADNCSSINQECYDTCKTCDIPGNNEIHNCKECNDNYRFKIQKNNYSNCYENCPFYHYFDVENNLCCTESSSCPNKYPLLNEDKNECIKFDIEHINEDIIITGSNNTAKIEEYYNNLLKLL